MACIAALPTEVVLLVLKELEYASEVSALAQTCRRLHEIADDYLYTHFANTYSPHGLHGVVRNGNIDALKKLLLAGVEFDGAYYLEASPFKTPLRLAASTGQVDILDTFANFFGTSYVTFWADELAKDAISNEHTGVLSLLLEMGVSFDSPDPYTMRTTLSHAAERGHLESLQLLFNLGCDINAWDVFQQTPLWWACKEGHLDVVKFLVEEGADPELASTESPGTAPIYCAALGGHRAVVQYLLEKGAHPSFQREPNMKALAKLAVNEMAKTDVILPLLFGRVDVATHLGWSTPDTRYYFLMCAAACGYSEMVLHIKDSGYMECHDVGGCSAVSIAASHGHSEIVGYLGAHDTTELRLAMEAGASAGHEEAVGTLIKFASPASVKELDTSAVTEVLPFPALSDWLFKEKVMRNFKDAYEDEDDERISHIIQAGLAAGNLKALGFLLNWSRKKQWSDVGYLEHSYVYDLDRRKFNLIEMAAAIGRVNSFNYIANKPWKRPNPTEKRWKPVLFFAARHKRVEIVRIFLDHGFDINGLYGGYGSGPSAHCEPLLVSFIGYYQLIHVEKMEERRMEGVRLLANRGADMNVMDADGETALGLATRQQDINMIKELLRHGANPFIGVHFTTTAFYAAFTNKKSPISLQLVEMYIEIGQERGWYPDFTNIFALGRVTNPGHEAEQDNVNPDNDDDEDDGNWDPKPTEYGLTEREWLKFLKMKRVRFLYWRLRNPIPGWSPKW